MNRKYMKTQADCYQALLEGKTLYCEELNEETITVNLVGGWQHTNTPMASYVFNKPKDWYIKQEWYEDESNFPTICYTGDCSEENALYDKHIAIITAYNNKDKLFICANKQNWKVAIPVNFFDFKQVKLTE